MSIASFHELKKQTSYFLREKIRTARLALTDVTSAQLMTEEATDGNPSAPDMKTMSIISRAAFETDDYYRIVDILHRRLSKFDKKSWREPYKALMLLERLLTHGPESVAEEFQRDRQVMEEMTRFQLVDEKGFNWGVAVRKKAERVLQLLERGPVLKDERSRARQITRGIQGFGSFNLGRSSDKETGYGRSNSHHEHYSSKEDAGSDVVNREGGRESDGLDARGEEKRRDDQLPRRDHPFNSEHRSRESLLLI